MRMSEELLQYHGKILVVSNECFCKSKSNGRTLMNLLSWADTTQLAQFYLHGDPDKDFCVHYFNVSDQDALNAFMHRKKKTASSPSSSAISSPAVTAKASGHTAYRRNYRNLVIRNLVWSSFSWWNAAFDQFLSDFAPDVILLQAGDMPFMYHIARKIAKQTHAALVMFNTEGYVLKQNMYNNTSPYDVWHKILRAQLRTEYKHFMQEVDFCIYCTEYLEQCYQRKYPHPGKSTALYTVSELKPLEDKHDECVFSLLYCGNLGVGRIDPLVEMGRALSETDGKAVLHIYGKCITEEDEARLTHQPNIVFHGLVPYETVPKLMSEATMLVHCENNDRVEDLKYAFSTKIADSLACGRPFLVYASREYPFVRYLLDNQCAHVASSYDELVSLLRQCREDAAFRGQYLSNAAATASENHSNRNNAVKIIKILNSL